MNDNDSQKPTIFFVWNYLEWGGGQIYLLAIMRRAKTDWNVRAVLPTGSSRQIIDFIEAAGVPYTLLDAHLDLQPAPTLKRKLQRHFNKLRCEWRTCRFLSGQKYNALHYDIAPWNSFWATLFLLRLSAVFVTMHNRFDLAAVGGWRLRLWRLKMRILARFDNFQIFLANADAQNNLREFAPSAFVDRTKITYAAIDAREIERVSFDSTARRESLLRRVGLPVDKFSVFAVGQFVDRKGRWIFLEAARQTANDDTVFVWITNSLITAEDRAQIAEFELSDKFYLIESAKVLKNRGELLSLIAAADVFALPSFVEGLPIALLEAMALSVPSISTNINGIPEAIIHHETGLLIEPSNHAQLAQAISELKNDPDLRRRLAENGRRRVLQYFTEDISTAVAITEYNRILQSEIR